jgi:hypothetical protein
MVYPTRSIAAILCINYATVIQRKVKGMVWVFFIMGVALDRQLPTNALAFVLNNGLTFFDWLCYKNAFAMNG